MKSILKESKLSINLEDSFSIKRFVDTTTLTKRLKYETSLIINNTRINKVNGLFYVKSFKSIDNLLKSFLELDLESKSIFHYIENIMLDKEIIIKKTADVLMFSYIDLLFNYYLLKSNKNNVEKVDIYLSNISKIIGREVIIKGNNNKFSGNTWTQSTLLETAMGSIEWVRDKTHPYISHNANKYLNEINAKLVEIPKEYDLTKLESSLKEISTILNEFKINEREFIIRFRKIRKLKKTGLFIVSANTIILDPRETDSFKHELGHYIYENKVSVEIHGTLLKYNDYQTIVNENFAKYSGLLKKHKIEDYKECSEIFAYSFEELMMIDHISTSPL